jgi:hypothetical protein
MIVRLCERANGFCSGTGEISVSVPQQPSQETVQKPSTGECPVTAASSFHSEQEHWNAGAAETADALHRSLMQQGRVVGVDHEGLAWSVQFPVHIHMFHELITSQMPSWQASLRQRIGKNIDIEISFDGSAGTSFGSERSTKNKTSNHGDISDRSKRPEKRIIEQKVREHEVHDEVAKKMLALFPGKIVEVRGDVS